MDATDRDFIRTAIIPRENGTFHCSFADGDKIDSLLLIHFPDDPTTLAFRTALRDGYLAHPYPRFGVLGLDAGLVARIETLISR